METCMGFRYYLYMYIECVFMEKEIGDLVFIYFKVIILYYICILIINRIYNRLVDNIIFLVFKVIWN